MVIYLATPYSHPNEEVRELRFHWTCGLTRRLLVAGGHSVFSPIVHSHSLAARGGMAEVNDPDFWLKIDLPWMMAAERVCIGTFPDWEKSRGCKREFEFALSIQKPVFLLSPEDLSMKEFSQWPAQ